MAFSDPLEALKRLSASLVTDDEYVLIFVIFLGLPAVLILWFIYRYIQRYHNRVRYASEYVRDSDSFVTSSSTSSSDDEENGGGRRGNRAEERFISMEEVIRETQTITAQERLRRRGARRTAAADGEVEK